MRDRSNSWSDRSEVASDPISALVASLDCSAVVKSGLTATGRWALRCCQPTGFKFFAVVAGGAWIGDGSSERWERLRSGDVVLLNGRQTFILASDPSEAPVDAAAIFDSAIDGMVHTGTAAGQGTRFVGGRIDFDPLDAGVLAQLLPSLSIVVAGSVDANGIRSMLDRLVTEIDGGRPGRSAATEQWAKLIVLDALRSSSELRRARPSGLLGALADPRTRKAVEHMQVDPSRNWTVQSLAQEVAMSRTSFATHFKAVTGASPLEFLTNWRMRVATRLLVEGRWDIASVARTVGYGSESSFGAAYKRVTGTSPGRVGSRSNSTEPGVDLGDRRAAASR